MKNTINKIFSDEIDEMTHEEFIKFSKGVFDNRYLIEGKRQKNKTAIKTSSEFANYFVRRILEKINEEIEVKGAIITTLDIKGDLDFEIKGEKRYMGIRQLLIDTKIESSKLLEFMDKYPKCYCALTFKVEGYELKIKPKVPKSGKPPKKGDDAPRADFCTLKTNDQDLINDIFFDFVDFQEIRIKHIIEINEIELPQGITNPKEVREKAIRKGKLKRVINIEGREELRVKEFSI